MGTHDEAQGTDHEVIDLRAIDRRRALKTGAVVAGAALWATPVVQTVGISRAAAQEPSETEPTTTTTMVLPTTTTTSSSTTSTTRPHTTTLCNIQIVVRHNGCLHGLLYDGHKWIQWSDRAPDAVDCIRFFGEAHNVDASWLLAFLFSIKVPVTKVDDSLWRIVLPLPRDVEFVAGWGQVGDASVTGCRSALVTPTSIDFSAS